MPLIVEPRISTLDNKTLGIVEGSWYSMPSVRPAGRDGCCLVYGTHGEVS
jgi:hypothetical protein